MNFNIRNKESQMQQAKPKSAARKKPDGAAPAPVAAKAPRRAKTRVVTPEERSKMIAVAAYYISEKGGAGGGAMNDWLEAESQIDHLLLTGSPKPAGKQEFQSQLEGKLQDWDARLEKIRAKAAKLKAEHKADIERQIEAAGKIRAEAHGFVEQLRHRTDDAWEDVRGGAEKAWEQMKQALDHLASRFK